MKVTFNNKRSQRMFVCSIFEDLARIEEICKSLSFYLSKLYGMEPLFGRRSKYALIAKQAVFLAIQRSNSLSADIMRRADTCEQNETPEVVRMKEPFSELHAMVKRLEKRYHQSRYKGILDGLREIGENAGSLKEGLASVI